MTTTKKLYDWTLQYLTPWTVAQTNMGRVFLLSGVVVLLWLAAIINFPAEASAAESRAPYSRAQFGPAWADVDRNGCDTRNDILARDMPDETFKPRTHNCVVLTGTLRDPYTGKTIKFVRGPNSRAVEVDHVVSLSNAWATGAQRWSPAQRLAFANDPLNLLAVSGPANQQKGAGDAATWLPQKSYRHDFVLRQIAVKTKYHLSVTKAEHDAMARWAR
jgi:hypothetical protein